MTDNRYLVVLILASIPLSLVWLVQLLPLVVLKRFVGYIKRKIAGAIDSAGKPDAKPEVKKAAKKPRVIEAEDNGGRDVLMSRRRAYDVHGYGEGGLHVGPAGNGDVKISMSGQIWARDSDGFLAKKVDKEIGVIADANSVLGILSRWGDYYGELSSDCGRAALQARNASNTGSYIHIRLVDNDGDDGVVIVSRRKLVRAVRRARRASRKMK